MTLRRQPSAVCAREREARFVERLLLERAAGAADREPRRRDDEAVFLFADDALLEAVDLRAVEALRLEAVFFAEAFLFGAAF
ncbi:MAG: hypothetical protein JJU12_08080 [Chlamydiales bacterium]|nr:hypothetical protein [Chlamydiales bacterium]